MRAIRTTPELAGTVIRVDADRTVDQATGTAYFTVEVAVAKHELARLGSRPLRTGMPAEALIRTESRTPLSYFMKPLTDHLAHAWREP